MLLVFSFILTIDQDVIDVDNDTDVEERLEDVLNQGLEGGWGVGKSKGHDLVLVVAISSTECSLLYIILVNLDLIITPAKVDFGEDGSSLESINEIINERNRESVLLGDLVECSVVNAHSKFSVFLLDKNDRSTIW